MSTDPTTDRLRALHLLEAADAVLQASHGEPMRDAYSAHMKDVGLLRRLADEADPMVGSLARDGVGLDEIAAMPVAAPDETLRDRLADMVVPLLLDTLPKVIARARGYEVADAVLALLPADSEPHRLALSDALGLGTSAPWDAIRERAAELHNGAGAPQPETQAAPRRGDAVEQWLKAQRDEYQVESSPQWGALDEVLDTYRLHADTGTPLGEHVCEGRVAGDCDCLEKPAAFEADLASKTSPKADAKAEIVHGCPPDGSGLTPCCGRTPFELPLGDRMSSEAPVTCTAPAVTPTGKEA